MATMNRSPSVSLNNSLGLNATVVNSPLNLSDNFDFLLPQRTASMGRFWSPSDFTLLRSPNISPIVYEKGSPSPFLKRREFKSRLEADKNRRASIHFPVTSKPNSVLEETLSVKTVLRELNLSKLTPIFDKEEINLTVFFTLTDDDLQTVGIENSEERAKIIDFITDFNTPKKPKLIPSRNYLIRH